MNENINLGLAAIKKVRKEVAASTYLKDRVECLSRLTILYWSLTNDLIKISDSTNVSFELRNRITKEEYCESCGAELQDKTVANGS